jgi:hypothetical protein
MVMGPTCGMVLADLGAEVIKIEPIDGDKTRKLLGSGSGFFPMFNRNKKSLAIDLTQEKGRQLVEKLIAKADVVCENFKPGTMKKMGLDYASLKEKYPRLIYVSNKGFLPGPYDHRTALDEVVQMMGGLAYMTGPLERPLRAGTSVNDIMGGVFGAIGVLAAIKERDTTGLGQEIQSALFENNVLLAPLIASHQIQLVFVLELVLSLIITKSGLKFNPVKLLDPAPLPVYCKYPKCWAGCAIAGRGKFLVLIALNPAGGVYAQARCPKLPDIVPPEYRLTPNVYEAPA